MTTETTPEQARELAERLAPADDWRKKGYDSPAAEIDDMANVGRSLMDAIACNRNHALLNYWSPADDPAEIVTDLLNHYDEAVATLTKERDALRDALTLAANRLARCALDHELFTEKYYEVAEWGEETRAALNKEAK